MMSEAEPKGEIYYAHPVTHAFLLEAIEDEAIARLWEEGGLLPRDIRKVYDYYFSPGTLQDLTDDSVLTYSGVHSIINRTIPKIWESCSEQVKREFPLEEMDLKKKITTETRRIYEELRIRLKETDDVGEIQELFQGVGKYFLELDRERQEDRVLMSVGSAIRKLKQENDLQLYYLSTQTRIIVESLRKGGVPIGMYETTTGRGGERRIQKYYFIAVKYLDRIDEVLRADKDLDEYREPYVQQVYGPRVEEMPASTERLRRERMMSVVTIIRYLGRRVGGGGSGKRIKDFLDENCPVPVFRVGFSHLIDKEDKDIFEDYILERNR